MIYIGTSGYSYRDWVGPVYPKGTKNDQMLPFYTRLFPFTELNFTYYRLPEEDMLRRMSSNTPGHFRFAVKAHSSMTHSRDCSTEDLTVFTDALMPLATDGKLAGILLQFPYSFHHTPENRLYLAQLRRRLGSEWPLMVEFRNVHWLEQDVFEFLKEHELGFVCVDQPRIKGLLPALAVATTSIGYVRFHGRNKEHWYKHEQSYQRYDYLYTEQELREWVPKLERLKAHTDTVYVSMNNHYQGKAVQNAKMLQQLLRLT
ncbi:MAG: DUF72 domain-containing protein [Limnochordia bacterium]|nr:DUF72 domain-containing protein [Limnochordia bacterium]MDD2629649.1 DUF72 domain-containing protein [Limnochordia bacterium]